MAKIPNKAKDATEEAMSAIQEALKVRDAEMKSAPARAARPVKSESDGRPDPAAARAGRIPTAPDDDLFGEVRLGENEPRRPANDDWKSMGQILQSLQPRASRTGYVAAAIASLVWVILVGLFASSALPDLRTTENLGLAILALAATLLLPIVFFFVLAHMINRSREMRRRPVDGRSRDAARRAGSRGARFHRHRRPGDPPRSRGHGRRRRARAGARRRT